jgi:Tol biopolymer transport system component
MTFDGIWGYVFSINPQIPAAPTQANVTACYLSWRDNSASETGFRIEELNANTGSWNLIGSVGPNINSYCLLGINQCGQGSCMSVGNYRVQAYNGFGNSSYSNVANGQGSESSAPQTQSSVTSDPSSPMAPEPNAPPEVNIITRANEQFVTHDLAIAANTFDLQGAGTIVKVEFFASGNKLGEVADAPYVFVWNNVALGTYSLTAVATDNTGATTTSAPATITVDMPPTVSITSPTSGTTFNSPATITINANAFDDDGSISKVEFFQGSIKLGEDANTPYNFDWSNVAAGSYSLTAIATDNLGTATTSSPVSITVNAPPAVSITSPAAWTVFTAPAAVTLNTNASDADGTVDKVEFYQGTTLLGTDTTSPYSFTWTNVSAGSYSITAKATDDRGGVTTSSPISITVNAPPSISITSPTSGATFVAPINIAITAVASDDGTVYKIEYFQNGILIATGARTGSFTWNNVAAGIYSLTAKATDNLGATTTSSSINITVVPTGTSNKIAFASNRDGIAQLYSMNADGTSVSRLTTNYANDESPKWSPNNSRIVFQSDRENPFCDAFDIYSMNSDGSGQTRLTTDINDDRAPVWSPDGTKIAFQSLRNGVNYQVYVMNADGSGQVNISNSTSNDTQPSWSPDGTKIAFASDRDQAGFPSIYVMNADGNNQTRLTFSSSGFLDDQPAWSPDGTKLAFTSTRDSTVSAWDEWILREGVVNKEIYVMNADGSSQARLTNVMGNDDSPSWLPDGTKIAFRSDRDRNCCDPYEQVWVMNADGSNQVNLSNNQFGDHCPSWSR